MLIPQARPDRFFTAEQTQRLTFLMNAWREARDRGEPFPAEEQAELEQLVEKELEGVALPAEEMCRNK